MASDSPFLALQSMAASPGTELVNPASPPCNQPSYLKSYPYLFVRETDQVRRPIVEPQLTVVFPDGLLLYGLRAVPQGGGATVASVRDPLRGEPTGTGGASRQL